MTCSTEDCTRPAFAGGLCHAHIKARQRGRKKQVGVFAKRTPMETLADAAIRYAEAEEDREWERARDNLQKAAVRVGLALFQQSKGTKVSEALRRRIAAGLPVGRPPTIPPKQLVEALQRYQSLRKAAQAVGVSHSTVMRAVRKFTVSRR